MSNRAEISLSAVDRTRQAFEGAKKNLAQLDGLASSISVRFGTLGAAIATALTGASLKGAVDLGDQLNKLGQRTGVGVEQLSALAYAGKLSDVSIEDLAVAFKNLGNFVVEAAGGNQQAIATFRKLGVEIKDTSGAIRSTDDILGDVAESFSGYEGGAEKAALATALFKKNGESLIPFLNQGRDGLREMRTEAEKLGVVYGRDLAQASENFNDNLTRMEQALNGAKIALLGEFLPGLVRLTNELIAGRKAFGSFFSALYAIGVKTAPFATYEEGAKVAREEVDRLVASLDKIKGKGTPAPVITEGGAALVGPRQRGGAGATKAIEEQLDEARKRLTYFEELIKLEQKAADTSEPKPKTRAPIVGDTGAAERAANRAAGLARKALEDDLRGMEFLQQQERDNLQFQNAALQRLYDAGLTSVQEYYAQRREAADRAVVAQRQIGDQEIQRLAAFKKAASTPEDKAEADTKIGDALRKRAALEREAAQAAAAAADEEGKVTRALQLRVADLDVELQQLAGNDYAAAIQKIVVQTTELRTLLAQSGQGQQRATDFERLATDQAKLVELRRQYSEITTRAAAAEQALQLEAERTGAAQVDTDVATAVIRRKALEELQQLVTKTEALAKASDNPAAGQFLTEIGNAAKRAALDAEPLLLRLKEAGAQAGQRIAQGFEDAIVAGGDLRDVLGSLLQDLERLVLREIVTKPAGEALTKLITDQLVSIGPEKIFGAGTAAADTAAKTAATAAETTRTAALTAATAAETANTAAVTTSAASITAFGTVSTTATSALVTLAGAAGSAASALAAVAASSGTEAGGDVLGAFLNIIGLGNAKGNAFGPSGVVHAFAKGGVFNAPTYFKFAERGRQRDGLMAEAGPEAVMPLAAEGGSSPGVVAHGADGARQVLPLTRGPDGKLGVSLPPELDQADRSDAAAALPEVQAQPAPALPAVELQPAVAVGVGVGGTGGAGGAAGAPGGQGSPGRDAVAVPPLALPPALPRAPVLPAERATAPVPPEAADPIIVGPLQAARLSESEARRPAPDLARARPQRAGEGTGGAPRAFRTAALGALVALSASVSALPLERDAQGLPAQLPPAPALAAPPQPAAATLTRELPAPQQAQPADAAPRLVVDLPAEADRAPALAAVQPRELPAVAAPVDLALPSTGAAPQSPQPGAVGEQPADPARDTLLREIASRSEATRATTERQALVERAVPGTDRSAERSTVRETASLASQSSSDSRIVSASTAVESTSESARIERSTTAALAQAAAPAAAPVAPQDAGKAAGNTAATTATSSDTSTSASTSREVRERILESLASAAVSERDSESTTTSRELASTATETVRDRATPPARDTLRERRLPAAATSQQRRGQVVRAFARGDIFDMPTLFKFAEGGKVRDGVMGEAGPEAVMPLQATGGGGLGVRAQGADGQVQVLPLMRGPDGKLGVQILALDEQASPRGSASRLVAEGGSRTRAFATGGVFGAGPRLTAASSQRLGRTGAEQAAAGNSQGGNTNFNVELVNNLGVKGKVKPERKPNGDFKMVLDAVVDELISDVGNGGRFARAQESMFGVRRAPQLMR